MNGRGATPTLSTAMQERCQDPERPRLSIEAEHARRPCVPAEVGDVLRRALAKDPSVRPRDASELRDALDQVRWI